MRRLVLVDSSRRLVSARVVVHIYEIDIKKRGERRSIGRFWFGYALVFWHVIRCFLLVSYSCTYLHPRPITGLEFTSWRPKWSQPHLICFEKVSSSNKTSEFQKLLRITQNLTGLVWSEIRQFLPGKTTAKERDEGLTLSLPARTGEQGGHSSPARKK